MSEEEIRASFIISITTNDIIVLKLKPGPGSLDGFENGQDLRKRVTIAN